MFFERFVVVLRTHNVNTYGGEIVVSLYNPEEDDNVRWSYAWQSPNVVGSSVKFSQDGRFIVVTTLTNSGKMSRVMVFSIDADKDNAFPLARLDIPDTIFSSDIKVAEEGSFKINIALGGYSDIYLLEYTN